MSYLPPAPPGLTDDWGQAAWAAAWSRVYDRATKIVGPGPAVSAETWEADLLDPAHQAAVTAWANRVEAIIAAAGVDRIKAAIAAGCTEPTAEGAYWGTRSAWAAAGRRAAERVPLAQVAVMTALRETALREIVEQARALAAAPGCVREVSTIAVALVRLVDGRHRKGGVEQVVGGHAQEVFTQGQMEDVAVHLGRWLRSNSEGRPEWTAYPQARLSDAPELSAIESALVNVVSWVWNTPQTPRLAQVPS